VAPLTLSTLPVAVDYFEPLRLVFTSGCTGAAPSELWTSVEAVAAKLKAGDGSLTLAALHALAPALGSMAARFKVAGSATVAVGSAAGTDVTLNERLQLVLALLDGRANMHRELDAEAGCCGSTYGHCYSLSDV
jgi:hypothetical protein